MSGLIEEIQKAAINPKVEVSTLLRHVTLAAAKLKIERVESWVASESKGYANGAELPEYRKIPGRPTARTLYQGWQPLMLSKETEFLRITYVGESIAAIEALIQGNPKGSLIKPYPTELVVSLSKHNGGQITEAGCEIPRAAFSGVLDAVRNLILDWSIELERAGVVGDGISFTTTEQQQAQDTQATFNVGYINTMTGNLGVGNSSGDITNAPVDVEQVRSLVASVKSNTTQLASEGVDTEALIRAIAAVENAVSSSSSSLMRDALLELKSVVAKAIGGLAARGVISILNTILGTGVPNLPV